MEKTVQSLCFGDNAATVPPHIATGPSQGQKLKKDDVDFIVSSFLLRLPPAANEARGSGVRMLILIFPMSVSQVNELLVSRQVAESTLAKHNGDMKGALTELVSGS